MDSDVVSRRASRNRQLAGNLHKASNFDPTASLSPRSSFEAWQETVDGRGLASTLPEIDATKRLRVTLLDIQQNHRVRRLNRDLAATLHEKDALLKQNEFVIGEVNHRVQNSLQLVSGFLALQARASDHSDVKASLEEARRRLTAVALVHRRLYRGDEIGIVDVSRFIEELCADTVLFMGKGLAKHLSQELSPFMISTDIAIPLSLVLTELLINCNKYAYAGQPGPVEIQLTGSGKHLHLSAADKGLGKPPISKDSARK